MNKIILSKQAISDLDNIYSYISKDSVFYWKLFTSKLKNRILKLKDFPFSWKVFEEIWDYDIREIIFENYRIIYEIKWNLIFILTISHSSKNLEL